MIAIAKADTQPSWCPGCGNYSILKALREVLATGAIDTGKMVLVSGIGQAAKLPHNIPVSVFNGLHGRALPAATGIKIANHELEVAVFSGDGDMYGEGGNHFLHNLEHNSTNQPAVSVFYFVAPTMRLMTTAFFVGFRSVRREAFPA